MILTRILLSKANKVAIPLNLRFNRINTLHHKYSTTKFQSVTEAAPTKDENLIEEMNKPIEYSKSAASRWQAKSSRMGTDMERLWYEPYVILASITVFMVYFCILREESDIDTEFEKTLYNRIRGMEERQLILCLEYNRTHGLETKMLEDRLREIEQNK